MTDTPSGECLHTMRSVLEDLGFGVQGSRLMREGGGLWAVCSCVVVHQPCCQGCCQEMW